MKILHTSDWHLGRPLHNRKRYEEQAAFLDWLAALVDEEQADVLLVAGDVFDTTTPSNRAQELYYRFLTRVAGDRGRHVVVTAGNHDSPSFLEAAGALLARLQVHVVTGAAAPERELIEIPGPDGACALLVCAVPYLRDREMRVVEAGDSWEDRDRKLLAGIASHYRRIGDLAAARRRQLGRSVPVVAMGHLFAAGGVVDDADAVRDLYVGSLVAVDAAIFADVFDYVALGHLHRAQTVAGREVVRYSGAPLPMSFAEGGRRKTVCRVVFEGGAVRVDELAVPVFQRLERICGDAAAIAARIDELRLQEAACWLEIDYQGDEVAGALRARIEERLAGSRMELLALRNCRLVARVLAGIDEDEVLAGLDRNEVFARCLDAHRVPGEQRPALLRAHAEALAAVDVDDRRAE
ncbi:MAG: exonuclease SbcCD subunit D C-terminal domain-containing protein [Thermodesulfobacteriota bacterium]